MTLPFYTTDFDQPAYAHWCAWTDKLYGSTDILLTLRAFLSSSKKSLAQFSLPAKHSHSDTCFQATKEFVRLCFFIIFYISIDIRIAQRTTRILYNDERMIALLLLNILCIFVCHD